MAYLINVALNGTHLFATADHSIGTTTELLRVMEIFEKKFPEAEGYSIGVQYDPKCLHGVHVDTAAKKIINSYYDKE